MKYIIFKIHGLEQPIVFPKTLDHDWMGKAFRGFEVISAGFCYINSNEETASAYGESISLGIKSRPEDSDILRRFLVTLF